MEDFDPAAYINGKFNDSSIYEINEHLVNLNESFNNSSHAIKTLVSSHFSKIVKCRSVLEDIFEDMKYHKLDCPNNDHILKTIQEFSLKHQKISQKVKKEYQFDSHHLRKEFYKEKFSHIFNMKNNLSLNLNNFENFVKIYTDCKKLLLEAPNSKFLQKKFEEIIPEKEAFLNKVYGLIVDGNLSFEDIIYHFELYFLVSEEESDKKIQNTILVNFKAATYNKIEIGEVFIDYIMSSYTKISKHLEMELLVEAIDHLFICSLQCLKESDARFCKFIIKKFIAFKKRLGTAISMQNEFQFMFLYFRVEVFKNLIEGKEANEILTIYEEMQEVFDEEVIKAIHEVIVGCIKNVVNKRNLQGEAYLKTELQEIKLLRKCLGSKKSRPNQEITRFLSEYKDKAIDKIGDEFIKTLENADNSRILFEATKIIKEFKEYHKTIFFQCKKKIMENKLVYFFLSKTMRIDPPVLSKEEKKKVDNLSFQYSFFLG